ncbi:hypothetical protein HanHA300_Chr16g0612601 [Helianthus annuus]|nr:hypothetical protein HanHA300_Chr16g0612601 [Helianthus annuus]KAJ0460645.1 hypothetical protein HanHA89_Chr16g0663191 [Helianthus annuus]
MGCTMCLGCFQKKKNVSTVHPHFTTSHIPSLLEKNPQLSLRCRLKNPSTNVANQRQIGVLGDEAWIGFRRQRDGGVSLNHR